VGFLQPTTGHSLHCHQTLQCDDEFPSRPYKHKILAKLATLSQQKEKEIRIDGFNKSNAEVMTDDALVTVSNQNTVSLKSCTPMGYMHFSNTSFVILHT
jgi:hypothetical protein